MIKRSYTEVLKRMIVLIPETEVELIKALEADLEDGFYKAPEETVQWWATSETLELYIPLPKEDWHFEILSIYTNKSIEEIKKVFFT